MSWARYDDELPLNRKVGNLRAYGVDGIAALGLHLLANCYARHNGTAGKIDAHVPEILVGRCGKKLAGLLAAVGMFDATNDGWFIHDFEEFHDPGDPEPNRSAADRKRDLSEKRKEAGRRGGQQTASKRAANPSNAPDLLPANAEQTSSPVPVPVPSVKDSLPPTVSTAESRLGEILDRYEQIALERSKSPVPNPVAYKAAARKTCLAMKELTRWADLFPTAPPDAVAGWLHGDRGSMAYYPRADELAEVVELRPA
jgi:general stress protein YciG